jgi:lycopene cyclase domain-containing protein
MTYTALAVIAVLAVLALELIWIKSNLLRKPAFYFGYLIVVFFQLLTNGYLTKTGIVLYDPSAIIGARIAYAPVEDLLFGFSLVFLTMAIWVRFSKAEQNA